MRAPRAFAIWGLVGALSALTSCSSDGPRLTDKVVDATTTTSKRPTNPFYLNQQIALGNAQLLLSNLRHDDTTVTLDASIRNVSDQPLDISDASKLFTARLELFGTDIAARSASSVTTSIAPGQDGVVKLRFDLAWGPTSTPVVMFSGDALGVNDATVWLAEYSSEVKDGS